MASVSETAASTRIPSKVKVAVDLHPVDNERARAAAAAQGMGFREFCALAIHRAVTEAREDK
jgi:hypothetical protein